MMMRNGKGKGLELPRWTWQGRKKQARPIVRSPFSHGQASATAKPKGQSGQDYETPGAMPSGRKLSQPFMAPRPLSGVMWREGAVLPFISRAASQPTQSKSWAVPLVPCLPALLLSQETSPPPTPPISADPSLCKSFKP